ncbi:hypothetical protein [Deinococcus aquiradiocola]|uniref:Uncharacterized protein n=1 Tax=Deinococcus aquiradiocola TaxID=393059 RepID=A0A917PNV0_9DEIO|nr:hypothetical protein [Deinococcus aquiradiocola]GGJ85345.1 hypothetical protein GCM10008939_31560 [Deinococcus aquiradiocola]
MTHELRTPSTPWARRTAALAVGLAALTLAMPGASAHEIARDGNVGGLLHIEPDDAPVVGRANAFYFEVNQKGGTPVLLTQCACTLSVYAGGVRAGATPLSRPRLTQAKGELKGVLNFPTPGAYTLVLNGTPRAGATFGKFKLSWVVRADVAGTGGMDMNH